MRFADSACAPGSVATTLTISTGCGTRRAGCWMNESNATCRRPPAARLQTSSSDLIQRRAAPMPSVSESLRERVCRVPKDASVRTLNGSMTLQNANALKLEGCALGLKRRSRASK